MSAADPRTTQPGVSLVVPCYNEAARLDVAAFREFLGREPAAALVLVDDGSTDATGERLEEVRGCAPERVEVLRLDANRGKAEAVRAGLLRAFDAGAPYAGYWDADLATPLGAVADLRGVLDRRPAVDVVFGARVKLLGRSIERNPLRHYFGRVFATVVATMLRLPVYDTQCGAKLLRATPEIRELFDEPFLTRWIFDVEILARLTVARRGTDRPSLEEAVYEFPLVEWRDVKGSKVRARDFGLALADTLRIYRAYLRPGAPRGLRGPAGAALGEGGERRA